MKLKNYILLIALLAISTSAAAQGRKYITDCIQQWGECRNVAITKSNGDVALYGKNGSAQSGCPQGLVDALRQLNSDNEYIDDIELTEQGRYLILYGDNGIQWNDIPYSLESKLREFNKEQEVINTVTFNDDGDWIIITNNYISASDADLQNWLVEGLSMHGKLWTACITDDALVAVYENGYRFLGNVPDDLKDALQSTNLDVYRLKISGPSWFFADEDGNYRAYM